MARPTFGGRKSIENAKGLVEMNLVQSVSGGRRSDCPELPSFCLLWVGKGSTNEVADLAAAGLAVVAGG